MQLEVEQLFVMDMFGSPHDLGNTPLGSRRFVQITGGSVAGERIKGELLPAGADIALIRPDGIFEPHVNAVLKTDDGALIHITYHGRFHAPPETMRKLIAREGGVAKGEFYLWNAMFFETSAEKYLWLNGITAVSTGMPQPISERGIGMRYEVFALKA